MLMKKAKGLTEPPRRLDTDKTLNTNKRRWIANDFFGNSRIKLSYLGTINRI
jgi:hypothetical protein